MAKTGRPEAELVPKGVTPIADAAKEVRPDENAGVLASGDVATDGYLVACPGVSLDWETFEGLPAALGKNGVCSNYSVDHAEHAWRASGT